MVPIVPELTRRRVTSRPSTISFTFTSKSAWLMNVHSQKPAAGTRFRSELTHGSEIVSRKRRCLVEVWRTTQVSPDSTATTFVSPAASRCWVDSRPSTTTLTFNSSGYPLVMVRVHAPGGGSSSAMVMVCTMQLAGTVSRKTRLKSSPRRTVQRSPVATGVSADSPGPTVVWVRSRPSMSSFSLTAVSSSLRKVQLQAAGPPSSRCR